MKKNDIYKIWKDLLIDNNKIEKILLKITGLSKSQLFLCEDIDNKYLENIFNYFKKIIKGEPLEYITNNAEFYWFDFYVDNRVLIPRNDTEIMVYKAIEEIKKTKEDIILIDVWTWTSCIVISILKSLISINSKKNESYVIDISKNVLEVSKINIKLHELENQITQIKWDLLEYFLISSPENISFEKERFIEKKIIITANLPYIKNGDFENMDEETINFEPSLALYWWVHTWFELYEKMIIQCIIFKEIRKIYKLILFIEIWFDQKEVCENYLNNFWIKFEIFRDNWWIDRCVKILI